MNWDAVGALGQIVGAFVVVLSLAYLATQVGQNTRGLRSGATAEAIAAVRDMIFHLVADPSMIQIFRKGMSGLENLSEDESAQFMLLTMTLFKTTEHLHFQYVNGAMDAGVWAGWEYLLSGYLITTGCQQYYRERQRAFNPSFQKWMDNRVPETEFTPFGGMLEPTAEPAVLPVDSS